MEESKPSAGQNVTDIDHASSGEESPGDPATSVSDVSFTPVIGRTLDLRDYKRMFAQCEELRRINTGLESEKLRHEALIADLEERGRRDEQFIAVLEEERSKFRAEIDSLKRDRAEWASQLWVLKKTYADYTQTIEAYERCCESQAAEIEHLKQQVVQLGGSIDWDDEIELPSQPTEPIPELPLENPVTVSAAPEAEVAEKGDDPAQKPAKKESEHAEEEPLDLLDSERLHEALEESAFFSGDNQPSFSMPKGRISASLSR